jgi:ABC-2 type transport system permease protein
MQEAEYRVNFLLGIAERLAQVVVAVLSVLIMFRFTQRVAGWSAMQVLLLVGIYRIAEGLLNLQIAPNMMALSGYIRKGDMDFLLLRPLSTQFLVSFRLMTLPETINVLIGLALALYASHLAHIQITLGGLAAAVAFGLCGLILLYALWLFTVTWSFWLVKVDTLDTLFYGMFEAGRYPVSFFKGAIRALLTFVVPVAFATTFPAEAVQGKVELPLLFAGIGLSAVALLGTSLFWRYAVQHYSSASS